MLLVQAWDAALRQIDAATRASARHAVIVLRDEDKANARAQFKTPLVFSVHEAKGLEYPHVVLMGMVSGQRAAYAEVCDGVTAQDLQRDELDYRRAKDRVDEQFRQKPCDYVFKSVLGSAVTARVLTCPPTVLAALRLRAAVGLGAAPTGMKVLWDLYRLVASGELDSSLAPGAVADAFRDRGVSAPRSVPLFLSEEFASDASRQQVRAAFLKRARVEAPVLCEVLRCVQREVWPWLVQGVSPAVP